MGRAELVVPKTGWFQVMVERYEIHVGDTVADLTGREADAQRRAVELIDCAAIANSPHRFRRNECHCGAVNGAIATRRSRQRIAAD
jgi:hypothetical protein